MNGTLHGVRLLAANLAVFALGLSLSPAARAVAAYFGDLELTLLAPRAELNLFGYGGPWMASDSDEFVMGAGMAYASEGRATRYWVPVVPPPPTGSAMRWARAVDDVEIAGNAGPGNGISEAESQGVIHYRLLNLSGGGDPTPAAQVFNAVFDLSFDYSLITAIGDPESENAEAGVGIYARAKPEFSGEWTQYYQLFDVTSGNDSAGEATRVQISIPMLPNGITLFELQYFLNGQATSVSPPLPPIPPLRPPPPMTVPEGGAPSGPGTLVALLGLLTWSKSRRQTS